MIKTTKKLSRANIQNNIMPMKKDVKKLKVMGIIKIDVKIHVTGTHKTLMVCQGKEKMYKFLKNFQNPR